MRRIAIAGGIGAGKTAVTDRLTSLGWPVIDADVIAREVTGVGQPAWIALRDAFGDAVLAEDHALDRPFVAQIVFHDPSALRRLNHITHSHIGIEIVRQFEYFEDRGAEAAFVALPLFRPEHRTIFALDEAWAVQVIPETAVSRLVEFRGFSPEDAFARLESQITNDERGRIVDDVLWNEGSLDDLYRALDGRLAKSGLLRG